MLRLARWEWFRLRRRGPFIALAALAYLVPGLVLCVTVALAVGWIEAFGDPGHFQAAAGSLAVVAPLLAIMLASLLHANDLQNGNCRMLTSRGDSRDSVLASKALLGVILLLGFHLSVLGPTTLIALGVEPHFSGWRTGLEGVRASFISSLLYLSLASCWPTGASPAPSP